MALLQTGLDYSDKDFDSLRARLHNLIDSVFPDWTDKEVATFGNILVESFAFVGDVLTFYQDNQAKESRITTARLRRSMLQAVKLIGYKPIGQVAATTELTYTLSGPPAGSVTIAAGDRFRTQRVTDPVTFQALQTTVIPAGANPAAVLFDVEHSTNSSEVFQSSALPNQEIRLNDRPFLDGSLVVSAADGAYSVVEDFLDSTASDRHVTVQVDANDRATLRFGNGIAGAVPQGTISCAYKTGGGVEGNVEPGTIRRVEKVYTDSFGNPVQVTVTNAARATGGLARQTVEAIRTAGPRSLRALTRSVGREDFEIHALKVAGVARALMLTTNQRAAIEENTGQLVIVPGGGGQPSETLKAAVLDQITNPDKFPHTLTFSASVVGPDYRTINVFAKVFPRTGANSTAAQLASMAAAIRGALQSYFALELPDGGPNPTTDFGLRTDGLVAFSDIYNVVRDVAAVRRIGDHTADFTLNGEPEDVEIEPHEFPLLGTVTIVNGFTGALL